jgi:hypothetical protein
MEVKAVKTIKAMTGTREDKRGKETKVRYLALIRGETCHRAQTSRAASV